MKFRHEAALFAIGIIIFLKSMRHLLKTNNYKTLMLVWNSSGCSLRKYIVLCTHIIVTECYSFSKIEKNSKNSYFIIFFHFQHPHTVSKPYWYVLKIAFNIVSQVCFMFSHETLEQAHSVTRSHKDLNFEKSSETPQV